MCWSFVSHECRRRPSPPVAYCCRPSHFTCSDTVPRPSHTSLTALAHIVVCTSSRFPSHLATSSRQARLPWKANATRAYRPPLPSPNFASSSINHHSASPSTLPRHPSQPLGPSIPYLLQERPSTIVELARSLAHSLPSNRHHVSHRQRSHQWLISQRPAVRA